MKSGSQKGNIAKQSGNQNARQSSAANRSTTQTRTTSVTRPEAQRPPQNRSTSVTRSTGTKVSTSNGNNPRNDYRSPNKTVNKTFVDPRSGNNNAVAHRPSAVQENHNSHVVREPNYKHHNEHVYYPRTKVKVYVHPAMHRNYRVLYYPVHRDIIWTSRMNRYYVNIYPGYMWRYPVGYRIQTISAFDTRYNVGEVARVYGRVYATWYNRESDDLLLFFGGEFPYQQFTMVIPGKIARRYSWRPEKYFLGQHVMATGLITTFDGSPEMIIKDRQQLDVY